jgi:hypothetical protein
MVLYHLCRSINLRQFIRHSFIVLLTVTDRKSRCLFVAVAAQSLNSRHRGAAQWQFSEVVLARRLSTLCIHGAEHVTHVFIKLPASWADTDTSRLQTL